MDSKWGGVQESSAIDYFLNMRGCRGYGVSILICCGSFNDSSDLRKVFSRKDPQDIS